MQSFLYKNKKMKYEFIEVWVCNFYDYLKLMFNRFIKYFLIDLLQQKQNIQIICINISVFGYVYCFFQCLFYNKFEVVRKFCQG